MSIGAVTSVLWASISNNPICKSTLLDKKPMHSNELIQDSYRRLHHVLKILTKIQRLANRKNSYTEAIYELKQQFATPSKR